MTVMRSINQGPTWLHLFATLSFVLGCMTSQSRTLMGFWPADFEHRLSSSETDITALKETRVISPSTNATSSKIQAVICTRVRNEAPYLREWIEYHRMIGFEAILLFNDNSTDDTQCILDAYAREGIVIRLPQDVNELHHDLTETNDNVFNACASYINDPNQYRFDPSQTWISTLDVDEFMYFNQTENVRSVGDVLSSVVQRYGMEVKSLAVPRLLFGSSEKDEYEPGLVINRFNRRFNFESCPRNAMTNDRPRHGADKPHKFTGISGLNRRHKGARFNRRVSANNEYQGRRKRFDTKNPISYCDWDERKRSYDSIKSFSNAASLAYERCEIFNERKGKYVETRCITTHLHALKDPTYDGERPQKKVYRKARLRDKRYRPEELVFPSFVIMHYMTKSRQEFLDRVCESVWSDKYFKCPQCTPETFFDLTQSYANNFQDDRMAFYGVSLKQVMKSSKVGATCNTEPVTHSPEFYQECLTREGEKDERKSR